jgi:predicted porin
MKLDLAKTALLATMIAGMAALPAHAQSTVTLYGLVDHGLLSIDHAPKGSQTYQNSNGINGNRVGFAGHEDLGGGLAAVFTLENGFDGSTGAFGMGNRAFGSQSFLGLTSASWGQLLAGRQVNVDIFTTGLLSAANQWAGLAGTHPGDNDNFYNSYRVPNSVKYISPTFGGVQVQALYGFGEFTGSMGRVVAAGVKYESGPLKLAMSVNDARNPNIGIAAGTAMVGTPVVPTTNFLGSTIVNGYASARDWRVFGAGVNYEIGAATLGLVYTSSTYRGLGDAASGPNPSGFTGDAKFRNYEVSARYMVSPVWQVGAEYVLTKRNSVATVAVPQGLGGASYRELTLGAKYIMSKRTFLYAVVSEQNASGIGSNNAAAVAHINGGPASSTDEQRHIRVGINHRF